MRPEELAAAAARIIGPAYEQAYETVIVAKDHVDSVDPLVFGLTVFVAAVMRYTAFGRYVFAIGSNEATARLCGLRVHRIKLYIYVIGGLCGGLAGVMQYCRLTVGDPTTAMGTELDVSAAVVIGGGGVSGGDGSAFGSLIGALIMAFLRNGCDALGVANWIQEILIGSVIVVAVALDQWRHRRTTG